MDVRNQRVPELILARAYGVRRPFGALALTQDSRIHLFTEHVARPNSGDKSALQMLRACDNP